MSARGFDYSASDFPHSPLLVFWELTRACDLVCQHCRACAQPRRHPNELDTERSLALIDSLGAFPKPPMLVLTGGDPLKRDDLDLLIQRAVGRELRVALTPSATPLLTRDALSRLKDIGLSAIALSLDGIDAKTHDAFRGVPGSYARTLDAMAHATELGFHVQINTTVSRENLSQIDAMAASLGNFAISTWSVFFLVPVGRGLMEKRLSPVQYEMVFAKLLKHSRVQNYRIKTTEAPHYRRFVSQQVPEQVAKSVLMAPTNDGRGVMFVSHVGDIYPSGFLPRCCGRFPNQSVVETYQHSPLFVDLRDATKLKGKCGACPYNTVCGGSRARAYAVTRDPLAAEPDCCFVPPGYSEVPSVSERPRSIRLT
jgi:AdoMet-dependent heme synthase